MCMGNTYMAMSSLGVDQEHPRMHGEYSDIWYH